jgi:putative membrane protein
MKEIISLFFKGMAMGAANVIPGVSGGTIALITGIFERLINAIKSFNGKAFKLLFSGKLKEFIEHTDLIFLIALFGGVAASIISVARLFDYLFNHYPVYIWSFFFGLILASVYFVGKTVEKWNLSVIIAFLIGTAAAISITLLTPASENDSFLYLMICGVVAVCSMILPGLSGSFVLILMGNYQLVMIDAINEMRIDILIPVVLGAGIGLLGFSYILSWVFKNYRNQTISVLTGFILGSLGVIWPWKNEIIQSFGDKEKVVGYDYLLPEMNLEFAIAFAIIILGFVSIWIMEVQANKANTDKSSANQQ